MCGLGDSENPRDSLSPRHSSDQGMEKTEGLQCGLGDSENPRDSLSPRDSGDGKDRGTAVWFREQ